MGGRWHGTSSQPARRRGEERCAEKYSITLGGWKEGEGVRDGRLIGPWEKEGGRKENPAERGGDAKEKGGRERE